MENTWILTDRSPVSAPKEYQLKRGKNTLGRKGDNDIVIPDDSASRTHTEIDCQANQIIIHDLNSTNGTFVNRVRLTGPHVWKKEDQIRIGQHLVTITTQYNQTSSEQSDPLEKTKPMIPVILPGLISHNEVLINEISSRLSILVDLDSALGEISKLMRAAMSVEKFGVILADRFDQMDELGFPSSIAKLAMEQRSLMVIPDLQESEHRSLADNQNFQNIRSILCLPVYIEEDIAGLVYAYRSDPDMRPFEEHDIQLALAVSQQVGLTVQRTRLREQVRIFGHLAGTDVLTGLPNRRQVFQFGEIEVKRALRFKHPLSVMMIDADNFKQINDTSGHLVGDQVLQTLIMRCKQGLREIDFLGRYGGDEFLAILVETGLESTHEVAGRIRQSVAGSPINTSRGALNMTISVGVATLNPPQLSLMDLLRSADDALYHAKQAGKNKVELSV